MLKLRFLSHNVRSDQNFESLGQEMKRCSKDSSASSHREQSEEVLIPIFLRSIFMTRYLFKILY